MRWQNRFSAALLVAASAVALWPAIAQRAPESILPPGFGQEPASNSTAQPERPARPATDLIPDVKLNVPGASNQSDVIGDLIEDTSNNMATALVAPVDLPEDLRRSLDRVGLMTPADGALPPNAFGKTDGRFLSTLLSRTNAPLASRWAQILLRRTLLSPSDIPPGIGGADWVAERAWLLLRMGEADMARALIARVDAVNFTPRLYEVAMQAALATGDPASLCAIATPAASISEEPSWPLAQAMCAALAGESGTASALVDRVRDTRAASGIDVLLAEKVVGAATNTRRSVSIQWDGVDKLDSWRFGLAVATGVTIPPKLFSTVGPQVQAWHARAPLIAPAARANSAELATAMGVMSSAALVDFYADLWNSADPAERSGSVGELLRTAFSGNDDASRLAAMRTLWSVDSPAMAYARQIMTARAAVTLPVVSGSDDDAIIASLMSAGLDIQAARWAGKIGSGTVGWAQLAVGSPRPIAGIDASAVRSVPGGEDDRRIKFLLAGLAGLGRLPTDGINQLAESYAVPLGRANSWTRAIDRAALAGEPASVVVLAAAGMQTREWRYVPPEYLYHIVAALRRVGLEPEARMIAAEALARA
jgi:hypothetical protein